MSDIPAGCIPYVPFVVYKVGDKVRFRAHTDENREDVFFFLRNTDDHKIVHIVGASASEALEVRRIDIEAI